MQVDCVFVVAGGAVVAPGGGVCSCVCLRGDECPCVCGGGVFPERAILFDWGHGYTAAAGEEVDFVVEGC